jgi:uncharacterized protein
MDHQQIIQQTQKWITNVVIGCNFCPFAAKEVRNNSIKYVVDECLDSADQLSVLKREMIFLDEHPSTETTLIIYPHQLQNFQEFLLFVDQAEALLKKEKYNGVYQLATFHPNYCFEGEDANDASNYTNRSIYPMLHLLREDSIYEIASKQEEYLETIPLRNITYALAKGKDFFEELRKQCMGR